MFVNSIPLISYRASGTVFQLQGQKLETTCQSMAPESGLSPSLWPLVQTSRGEVEVDGPPLLFYPLMGIGCKSGTRRRQKLTNVLFRSLNMENRGPAPARRQQFLADI